MPGRTKYHISPDGDRWKIQREGAQKPAKTFDNKSDAVDFGRGTAKNQEPSQLIIHKKDGPIQTEHTYKKNPFAPQG